MPTTNPPAEFAEWTLLRLLPQYTLEGLDGLPAAKVARYLMILEAQGREEARRARQANQN